MSSSGFNAIIGKWPIEEGEDEEEIIALIEEIS
jgi:hypothetical protein